MMFLPSLIGYEFDEVQNCLSPQRTAQATGKEAEVAAVQ
jgi:hypothetical protein